MEEMSLDIDRVHGLFLKRQDLVSNIKDLEVKMKAEPGNKIEKFNLNQK